ncbi:MAG: hypothetical protein IKN81_00825 [Oscillospiraceae bacterium]|nr:hypothetical protein [Oscillospiraceae bacterium]
MEMDYRECDRLWQRVSPELNPYPEVRAARRGELSLPPGTEKARCTDCRRDEAELLRGLLRDELADAETYRYLASHAPCREDCRLMRRLAADAAARVRKLQSAYYLLTGGTYDVTVVLPPQTRLLWRDRLRERSRAATDAGDRYAHAAEEMSDGCLKRLLAKLAEESYHAAELLRRALERAL